MPVDSRRTPVRGPTFVRLLARLTDTAVPPSSQSLPDRLSHWLDWKQSLALSAALDGKAVASAEPVPAFTPADDDECARVFAVLVGGIPAVGDPVVLGQRQADGQVEYTVFRQRYIVMQRKIAASTGTLRGRLRAMLAQASPAAARLADVDAAMELSLSPREHAMFSAVPVLLGQHFERLRAADGADATWFDLFRTDMQDLLRAELDVRFQPVDGLLAALRTCTLESHVPKPS